MIFDEHDVVKKGVFKQMYNITYQVINGENANFDN